MRKDNSNKMRIVIEKGKVISRKQLFKDKEKFHNEQAKLPFEEKIKILINLQKIAASIKKDSKNIMVWKLK